MCQHLTYLVYDNEYRFIAMCEHGTIHVTWQRGTVHLSSQLLLQLADFLPQAQQTVSREQCCVVGQNVLALDSRGGYQAWFYGVGFYLVERDLVNLTRMIADAAACLHQGHAPDIPLTTRPTLTEEYARFSLN